MITDEQIDGLKGEAAEAGDTEQVMLCEAAFGARGATEEERRSAREMCERVLARIAVGDYVVGGRGCDADVGRIVSLDCGGSSLPPGAPVGGMVAWERGCAQAWAPVGAQNDLDVFVSRNDALEELDRRVGGSR